MDLIFRLVLLLLFPGVGRRYGRRRRWHRLW